MGIAGIVLIGWLTLVSFTLSMSLAFRSRNIPLTEFWAEDAHTQAFLAKAAIILSFEKKTASGKTPDTILP
jgi:site-specific recombinase